MENKPDPMKHTRLKFVAFISMMTVVIIFLVAFALIPSIKHAFNYKLNEAIIHDKSYSTDSTALYLAINVESGTYLLIKGKRGYRRGMTVYACHDSIVAISSDCDKSLYSIIGTNYELRGVKTDSIIGFDLSDTLKPVK